MDGWMDGRYIPMCTYIQKYRWGALVSAPYLCCVRTVYIPGCVHGQGLETPDTHVATSSTPRPRAWFLNTIPQSRKPGFLEEAINYFQSQSRKNTHRAWHPCSARTRGGNPHRTGICQPTTEANLKELPTARAGTGATK